MKKSLARWRQSLAFLLAVLLLLSLAGCGGGGYSAQSNGAAYEADSYDAYDYDYPMEEAEYAYDDAAYYGSDYKAGGTVSSTSRSSATGTPVPAPMPEDASDPTLPQKLIRRASISMETTEFDQSAAALSDLVNSMGGYFSNASAGDQGGNRKRASYTIRIPSARFQDFLAAVGDICHETWRDVTQEDISERYYDTQGRLRTQNTKLTRLQELLTKAEDMTDIITIQDAISETEERIEELQGTLSRWDNQVDYATISLSLTEVYRLTDDPPAQQTYVERLGAAFLDGIETFFEWIGDLIVALAYSWLWWLLLALIVIACLRIPHTKWWQKKREERNARWATRQRANRIDPATGIPYGKMTPEEQKNAARNDTASGTEEQGSGGK